MKRQYLDLVKFCFILTSVLVLQACSGRGGTRVGDQNEGISTDPTVSINLQISPEEEVTHFNYQPIHLLNIFIPSAYARNTQSVPVSVPPSEAMYIMQGCLASIALLSKSDETKIVLPQQIQHVLNLSWQSHLGAFKIPASKFEKITLFYAPACEQPQWALRQTIHLEQEITVNQLTVSESDVNFEITGDTVMKIQCDSIQEIANSEEDLQQAVSQPNRCRADIEL